jgi:hypothetical protein
LDELRKVLKNLAEYVDEVKLKQVMADGDKDGATALCVSVTTTVYPRGHLHLFVLYILMF